MDERLQRFMEIMAAMTVIRQFCDESTNGNPFKLITELESLLKDDDVLLMAEFKKVLVPFQTAFYEGKRVGLYGIFGGTLPLHMLKVLYPKNEESPSEA